MAFAIFGELCNSFSLKCFPFLGYVMLYEGSSIVWRLGNSFRSNDNETPSLAIMGSK
jgi:hypothetical protein